jgi:hypothetical protein
MKGSFLIIDYNGKAFPLVVRGWGVWLDGNSSANFSVEVLFTESHEVGVVFVDITRKVLVAVE